MTHAAPASSPMIFQQISYEVEGPVVLITLNRADKLNAFTRTMARELAAALDLADNDPEIRAVVITGAGRAFCAGFELEDAGAFKHNEEDDGRDLGGRVALRLFECLKPVIAVINGPAIGIGVTMLLPMDYRIATDQARFGFVFVRRGIVPEAASSWFLPRLIGVARALDWMLSGRIFGAQEALEGGLVTEVLPQEEAMARARRIALDIAENAAPVSVSLTRRMIWQALTFNHPMEAHQMDSRLMRARGSSADVHEGVGAFLEKRKPAFPDRVPANMPAVAPSRPVPDFS